MHATTIQHRVGHCPAHEQPPGPTKTDTCTVLPQASARHPSIIHPASLHPCPILIPILIPPLLFKLPPHPYLFSPLFVLCSPFPPILPSFPSSLPSLSSPPHSAGTTVYDALGRIGTSFEVKPLDASSPYVKPGSVMWSFDGRYNLFAAHRV